MVSDKSDEHKQQSNHEPSDLPPGARQWYATLRAGKDPGAPTLEQFNGNLQAAQLIYDRYQQAPNFKDFEAALPILEQNYPFLRSLRDAATWQTYSPRQFVQDRPPASYCDADQIIQNRELTAVVSQPGVGKSFWMLHKAAELTDNGILVLLIAAEGLNPDRLLALEAYRQKEGNGPLSDRLQIIDRMVNLTDKETVDSFVEFVTPMKPRVIFFDTLAACNPGQDENSVQDMQPIMNRIRERIITSLDCAVVLLHHTTKDGKGFRGSNAIRASVTNMYYLVEEDERIILKSDKQRDAERDPDRHYQLVRFETRKHPTTGEQITSAVMLPATKVNDDPRHELTKNQRKILEALDGFTQGMRYNALVNATGLQKSSLYASLRKLMKAGFVGQSEAGGPYHITEQGTGALSNG